MRAQAQAKPAPPAAPEALDVLESLGTDDAK